MKGESYAEYDINAFLVHQFLPECIPILIEHHRFEDGRFYLRHANDKGDHILVDDE